MAKVQIKSEKLTPFGGFFRLWSPPLTLYPRLTLPSSSLATQLVSILFPHPEAREREDETRKHHL